MKSRDADPGPLDCESARFLIGVRVEIDASGGQVRLSDRPAYDDQPDPFWKMAEHDGLRDRVVGARIGAALIDGIPLSLLLAGMAIQYGDFGRPQGFAITGEYIVIGWRARLNDQ